MIVSKAIVLPHQVMKRQMHGLLQRWLMHSHVVPMPFSCFSPGKSRGTWPFHCEGQIHAEGQKTLVARLKTRIVFIHFANQTFRVAGWRQHLHSNCNRWSIHINTLNCSVWDYHFPPSIFKFWHCVGHAYSSKVARRTFQSDWSRWVRCWRSMCPFCTMSNEMLRYMAGVSKNKGTPLNHEF